MSALTTMPLDKVNGAVLLVGKVTFVPPVATVSVVLPLTLPVYPLFCKMEPLWRQHLTTY